jgi:UDPglucose--hexose-1-phosphate uridylyltransferase
MIGAVSRRMDNLQVRSICSRIHTDRLHHRFECSFGYSMGLYQAPVHSPALLPSGDEDWAQYAQLHLGFYPPLLRSSTVKKFLVG